MPDNTCACCGAIIPEGRQICLLCEGENEVQHFQTQIPPVRTNGDRIRQMTDEELAQFLCQIGDCSTCPFASVQCRISEWLGEKVSEDADM